MGKDLELLYSYVGSDPMKAEGCWTVSLELSDLRGGVEALKVGEMKRGIGE